MKQYYNEEYYLQESKLDDMENFVEKICIGEIDEVDKYTFFLPKLSEKEVQMIEDKNIEYLKSFPCYHYRLEDPNINPDEILNEPEEQRSKTRFLFGCSRRVTVTLNLPKYKNKSSVKKWL